MLEQVKHECLVDTRARAGHFANCRVQPPAKTDNRRNSTRSCSSSNSQLQSIVARIVWCWGGPARTLRPNTPVHLAGAARTDPGAFRQPFLGQAGCTSVAAQEVAKTNERFGSRHAGPHRRGPYTDPANVRPLAVPHYQLIQTRPRRFTSRQNRRLLGTPLVPLPRVE